jgi:thiol-disulfide isomerase/thioredoxin
MPRLPLTLILAAGVACPQDFQHLLRTIDNLTPKESLRNGIETELRAAFILRDSYPVESAALMKRGKARLAAHPEVVPSRWIVTSLFALDPEGAEQIILQGPRPNAFRLLVEHYSSRNQPGKVLDVLGKVLKDDGPAFTQFNLAIEKLIPLDPSGAASVYLTLRESPVLRAKYPGPVRNLPMLFSRALASAFEKHPEGVRSALGRLLPLFKDEEFLKDATSVASMKPVVAGQQIELKTTREAVLFSLGALSKAVAPGLYEENNHLFDSRVALVNTIADALAVANGPIQWNAIQTQAWFDFEKAPLAEALAEWPKRPDLNGRLSAGGTIIKRTDVSLEQKQAVMRDMLSDIRAADKQVRANASDDLIWYASRAAIDPASIRPAVELLVRSIPDSADFLIDDHATALVRDHRITLGENDASLKVRLALLEFEREQGDRYSFTLPSLDGGIVQLKQLRGKVVLLNFWATWCGPCRGEKPILERVYRDLKDKGFEILAITDEDPAVVRRFVKQFNTTLPIVIDQARSTFDHFNILGLPKTVILDRQGRPTAHPIIISDEAALRKLLAVAGVKP